MLYNTCICHNRWLSMRENGAGWMPGIEGLWCSGIVCAQFANQKWFYRLPWMLNFMETISSGMAYFLLDKLIKKKIIFLHCIFFPVINMSLNSNGKVWKILLTMIFVILHQTSRPNGWTQRGVSYPGEHWLWGRLYPRPEDTRRDVHWHI